MNAPSLKYAFVIVISVNTIAMPIATAGNNTRAVIQKGNGFSGLGNTKDMVRRLEKVIRVAIWVILLSWVRSKYSGKEYVKNMVNRIPRAEMENIAKYRMSWLRQSLTRTNITTNMIIADAIRDIKILILFIQPRHPGSEI
jgi:hypothetical protein